MSLRSSPAGGKGVDSGAVEAYDSGDEWDIGVGNLIIDLEADLEKDKLEMSGSKEGSPAVAAPPPTLPDSIKFVSPATNSRDAKAKSKRAKNSRDGKIAPAEKGKREVHAPAEAAKGGKPPRCVPAVRKERDSAGGKSKKDKVTKAIGEEGSTGLLLAPGPIQGEEQENCEGAAAEQAEVDTGEIGQSVSVEEEEVEEGEEEEEPEGGSMKMVVSCEKLDSPLSCSAPPPLHLLGAPAPDISSSLEQIMVRTRSVAVNTAETALATEPDCLGPCEPGTSVNLEGIVWQETDDGMLVVNVTWKNKTYVGTLLDCTRHDWAPPSDLEIRSGRGRGKRIRPGIGAPPSDNGGAFDTKGGSKTRGTAAAAATAAAGSKGRRGSRAASPSSTKRKTKPASDVEPTSSSEDSKASKRMRTNYAAGGTAPVEPYVPERSCPSPVLIDCPHPNCSKKYKHINGLKYHQAHAHNDPDLRLDQDGDSECGEDPLQHQLPSGLCPATNAAPRGRGSDAASPSSKSKGKKKPGESEPPAPDAADEDVCLSDEASNDGMDDRKSRRGGKPEKAAQKTVKLSRPGSVGTPSSSYAPQAASPAVVLSAPGTLQAPGESAALTPDRKKKEKKRSKDGESPPAAAPAAAAAASGRTGRSEVYPDGPDTLLNGCGEVQHSRLASMKAEADKVYSFSDHTPSPSLGATGGRPEPGQNGADNLSVKTGSPAYSDISDVGEDGEGKAEGVRVKQEPEQGPEQGPKKALFAPQAKESQYYPEYNSYYPPNYPNPGAAAAPPPRAEDSHVSVKKEEDTDEDVKPKLEPQEDRKPELGPLPPQQQQQQQQQPSVIQQRYAQPLYYNQFYVPPYGYGPEQAYQLLASSPAYRQQLDDRDREQSAKEEWRPKAPPLQATPSPNPSPAEPGAKAGPKPKEQAGTADQNKSVITVKSEETKAPPTVQAEGLRGKLKDSRPHGTEEGKPGVETSRAAAVDPAMWYRQEPDSRLWSYVYPSKYPQEDERWKEQRERRAREDRPRPGEPPREDVKDGVDTRTAGGPLEELQERGKEARLQQVQFPPQQAYVPYMQPPYAYAPGYEHGPPGFRGVPPVMVQGYPGPYLPAGYAFPSYGGKVPLGEEVDRPSRSSPSLKPSGAGGEAKALDLLQQHASQYRHRSPSTPDQRDRDGPRPRSSPSQRVPPPHHHVGYPLLSGQYDLTYASGLSSPALVAGQQSSTPSMFPPPRR